MACCSSFSPRRSKLGVSDTEGGPRPLSPAFATPRVSSATREYARGGIPSHGTARAGSHREGAISVGEHRRLPPFEPGRRWAGPACRWPWACGGPGGGDGAARALRNVACLTVPVNLFLEAGRPATPRQPQGEALVGTAAAHRGGFAAAGLSYQRATGRHCRCRSTPPALLLPGRRAARPADHDPRRLGCASAATAAVTWRCRPLCQRRIGQWIGTLTTSAGRIARRPPATVGPLCPAGTQETELGLPHQSGAADPREGASPAQGAAPGTP